MTHAPSALFPYDGGMKRAIGMMVAGSFLTACSLQQPIPRQPEPCLPYLIEASTSLFVSPQGSDENPGTEDAPLRTLSAAASRVQPGSTVWIEKGTYREQLVSRSGGTPGREIVFRGMEGAVIDGAGLPWRSGENQNQGLVELRHPFIRLEGLKILRSKNTGVLLAADSLTIRGCEIAEAQRHGVSTDTSFQPAASGRLLTGILLEENTVRDCVLGGNGFGQAISLIADGFTIRGNRLYGNHEIPIDVWLGARHGEVVGNEIFDNVGQTAIYVDGASYLRIHRNKCYRNAYGVMLSSEDPRYETHHVWVYNNLLFDHTLGGCAIWDPDTGPRDVWVLHNTLADNPKSFSFEGKGITAEVANNLVYPNRKQTIAPREVWLHDNLTLWNRTSFRAFESDDFHLAPASPAIDRGKAVGPFADDRGDIFSIDEDFDGTPRVREPDVGAFEAR